MPALPVIRNVITIAGQGSTIVRDPEAPAFRLLAVHSTGDLMLQETTVSGGLSSTRVNGDGTSHNGGGVANYGGTLTVMHSTIAGNTARYYKPGPGCYGSGRGGVYSNGTVTITNNTITGNYAYYGGWVANSGTLTLVRTLVSGNTAPTRSEIDNSGTVLADNYNLFGVNGTAGVAGFSPGATDTVPPHGGQGSYLPAPEQRYCIHTVQGLRAPWPC